MTEPAWAIAALRSCGFSQQAHAHVLTISVVRTNEKPDWLFYVQSAFARLAGSLRAGFFMRARGCRARRHSTFSGGLEHIKSVAPSEFALWLGDRKKARRIPHRLEACGYVPVRNPDVKDGLWKIDGTRRPVYARHELSRRDRLTAARGWCGRK
jgi:hypothetical protein